MYPMAQKIKAYWKLNHPKLARALQEENRLDLEAEAAAEESEKMLSFLIAEKGMKPSEAEEISNLPWKNPPAAD